MKSKLFSLIFSFLVITASSAFALDEKLELESLTYGHKGSQLLLDEKYEEALDALNHAISIDPNQSFFYTLRGMANVELGKIQRGLEDANRAIALDPKDGGSFYVRARVNQELGNEKEMIQDLIMGAKLGDVSAQKRLKELNVTWE